MKVAVLGASGFIGRALSERLATAGHAVVAVGRRPEALPAGEGITPCSADIGDRARTTELLAGVDVAYYLVHSMAGGAGFEQRDRMLAETFARAAKDAGVGRIAYLGALGSGELSPHLASRQEVGDALRSTGLDVVDLRAAVILGAGSISFEMLRYLVERLPAMVCPRWVRTRIAPVALADVLAYLEGSMTVEPGIYEIGMDEPSTYREMMDVYADVRRIRRRLILDVPLLTLRLSSYWVDLVTPVDRRVSHTLIESLAHEVVVRDPQATLEAFGVKPMPLRDAVRRALGDQAANVPRELFSMSSGLRDGIFTVRIAMPVEPRDGARAREDIRAIGGDLRWYGLAWAWRLRVALGQLLGERFPLRRPETLARGGSVDWWMIDLIEDDRLVLRAGSWRAGEAWLGYAVDEGFLVQAASLRPRGVFGWAYWRLLFPVHRAVFRGMARRRVRRARAAA